MTYWRSLISKCLMIKKDGKVTVLDVQVVSTLKRLRDLHATKTAKYMLQPEFLSQLDGCPLVSSVTMSYRGV